jgi:hypothetical protein
MFLFDVSFRSRKCCPQLEGFFNAMTSENCSITSPSQLKSSVLKATGSDTVWNHMCSGSLGSGKFWASRIRKKNTDLVYSSEYYVNKLKIRSSAYVYLFSSVTGAVAFLCLYENFLMWWFKRLFVFTMARRG